MRHRVKTKSLGRDKDHRKSLMRTLSTQLVEHESITTTLAKAKYLRPYFEKLITKAKQGSDFNNVKYMRKKLSTEEAVKKMLSDLGPRFKSRKGGYTRIIKVGERDGDKAHMARIELVEKPKSKKEAKKKTDKEDKKEEVKKETKEEKDKTGDKKETKAKTKTSTKKTATKKKTSKSTTKKEDKK